MSEENIKVDTDIDDDLIDISDDNKSLSNRKPNNTDKNNNTDKTNNNTNKKDVSKKRNGFLRWIKRHKAVIIIPLLIIAAIVGIRHYAMKKLKEVAAQNTTRQEFALIERQDISDAISTTGTIKASKTSKLYSALKDTKITAVNYEVGDRVNEGDVLITFSDENINKQIKEVQEDISIAKQKENIDTSDRNRNYVYSYGSQEYNLVVSADNVQSKLKDLYEACDGYGDAKRELQRLKDEGKSQNEIDAQQQVVSSYYQKEQSAQQAYDNAVRDFNEQVRKANNELASADSTYNLGNLTSNDNVKTLQRKLTDLQDSLSDYIVTAPISGTVTEVLVEAGNGFNAGDLMVIQQDDTLIVTAEIDEYDIPNVEKNQEVIIRTDATGDDELRGYVSFVSPVSTASSTTGSSTGSASTSSGVTYKVEITVTTKDDRLRIGMSAKLNIIINEHKDTLVVRYDAIETDDNDNTYIRAVDNRISSGISDFDSVQKSDSDGIKVIGIDGSSEKPKDMPGDISDFKEKSNKSDTKESDSINSRKIYVETGIVGDYYTEIISDEISEGMQVLVEADSSKAGDGMYNGMPMGGGPGGDGPMF